MRAPDVDVVSIVESLYRFDLADPAWLGHVGARLAPLLDGDHQGQVAALYRCPDPTAFAPTCMIDLGMRGAVQDAFRHGVGQLTSSRSNAIRTPRVSTG